MVHGKSSDLELLNAEEMVWFATMAPYLSSSVLPSFVSQHFTQYEAFEVADDAGRLVTLSGLKSRQLVARRHLYIADNMSVWPICLKAVEPPPLLSTPLRKNGWA